MSNRALWQDPLLRSPFHERLEAACATHDFARWNGYLTVNVFSTVEAEYTAIRNSATLYDISPMNKYRIAGADAARFCNRLVTRDIGRLPVGRVAYCLWCDDDGKVIDDGTLFRIAEEEYRLCAQERHLPWLLDTAYGLDVGIEDVTSRIAALSLQGPTSCAVLKSFGLDGIETLRPFEMRDYAYDGTGPYDGTGLTVSRTGFTGDLGYELWIAEAHAAALWDGLSQAAPHRRVTPVGSRAVDLARIEAGFIQTNSEFVAADQALRPTRRRTPFELGLGWQVHFEKTHYFVGRRALERCHGRERTRLVGLDVEGSKPAQGALVYSRARREAGRVTAAMWSPTCKRNIAFAELRRGSNDKVRVEIYLSKEGKWERRMADARVCDRRFFNHPRRTATPPADF